MIYKESQNLEFKLIWKDEYLRTLCAFANSSGGSLMVGLDDNGAVHGVTNSKTLLEVLPNKIHNRLGLLPDVFIESKDGQEVITITVAKMFAPISFNGKFYKRSGSITVELNGSELSRFLLNKYGKTWDDVVVDSFSLEDINLESVEKFKNFALDRVPDINRVSDLSELLERLNLYDGKFLKRAAVLLFGENPQKYFTQSYAKIGRFTSNTDIVHSDVIEGNLIDQVDQILDILRIKYLKANVHFEGSHRRDILEYPFEALREAVINALIHRDYMSSSNLQIRVYDNRLTISNGATLPEGVTVERLSHVHPSIPINPTMAQVFYKAGFIENWGRGTIKIRELCEKQGLPTPEFSLDCASLVVTFFKSTQESTQETAQKTVDKTALKTAQKNIHVPENVSEDAPVNVPENMSHCRGLEIIGLIQKNTQISMREMSIKLNVNIKTVKRDLQKLKQAGLLERIGPDKGGHWEVRKKL